MKKMFYVILLSLISCSMFAQKNKYEFRDLVFQCFEKIDDGKSDVEVKRWLKAHFKTEETPECYIVKGLPYGFNTNVYFHPTKIVFEQENVSSFEDLDAINRAIASAINAFKMFGYLDVVNYDYKIYDVRRKKTWRMTTDLNPYQGIAWLTIKGDVKIYKSKEQIAKEKKEAEEAKKKLEEQRKQEEAKQVKKQKEVEKILAIYQETDIKSKATDYLNTKYAKQIKECERKLEKLVLNYAGDVNILLCGDSTGINIVKLDEDIVNDELNNLQPSSTIFYTLNGENYYKCQDKIFFTKKIHVETKTFEHGYSGLKNRGGTFQYYGNILDMVKKACEQNFTKRGEYFFEYSIIGDEVIVKELILERKQRDEIRGKKTIGRKILTIGGSVVLLGVIAACSAL